MKNKEIKSFFNSIQNRDLEKVTDLINSNKEYLTVCNFAPPKKDDGQSGLQVAFKTGNFDIAKFLIEQGADVNFIEQSEINEWRAPVLHDCLRATIFNTIRLQKDITVFDKAFSLLQIMLSKNADPNAIDSYGNNCLNRVWMDTTQVVHHPEDLTNEILLKQIRSVFKELINAGADIHQSHPQRESFAKKLENERWKQYELISSTD